MSAWLLALNAGVFLLGALAISRKSTDRLRFYCTLLLLTEAATSGVLLSIDLLLFYMFWEGMLVPLYVLLSNWGGEKRGPATLKFIVYTVAGSLLMLVAIIYLYVQSPAGSFDLETILAQPIGAGLAARHPGDPSLDVHAASSSPSSVSRSRSRSRSRSSRSTPGCPTSTSSARRRCWCSSPASSASSARTASSASA